MKSVKIVLFLYALLLVSCNNKYSSQPVLVGQKGSAIDSPQTAITPIIDTGFKGIAILSPTCGAIPVDPPAGYCTHPYKGSFDIYRCKDSIQMINCGLVSSFESNDEGAFKVQIPAGVYLIQLHNSNENGFDKIGIERMSAVRVEVADQEITEVLLDIDSGIRAPQAQ